MTNKERLIALLGFAPGPNTCEAELLDAGIDPNGTYASDMSDTIKKAAIGVLRVIISTADTGNGEVGWTAKYDRPSILKMIADFKKDLGITDSSLQTITGVKKW